MLRITIPEPCHEDWNMMTPTEKGAFCGACSKEVVDFSGMSDDEVKNYFLQNIGKKTCGRFNRSQLSGLNIQVDEQVIYSNISLWKKFLAVVLICFGAFMSACNSTKPKEEKAMENVACQSFKTLGPPISSTGEKDTSAIIAAKPGSKITLQCPTLKGFTAPIFVPDDHLQGIPDIEPVNDTVSPATPVKEPVTVTDSLAQPTDTCNVKGFL